MNVIPKGDGALLKSTAVGGGGGSGGASAGGSAGGGGAGEQEGKMMTDWAVVVWGSSGACVCRSLMCK